MDVCDRVRALCERVAGIWDGAVGERPGGAGGRRDGEFGVDAAEVGGVCPVRGVGARMRRGGMWEVVGLGECATGCGMRD